MTYTYYSPIHQTVSSNTTLGNRKLTEYFIQANFTDTSLTQTTSYLKFDNQSLIVDSAASPPTWTAGTTAARSTLSRLGSGALSTDATVNGRLAQGGSSAFNFASSLFTIEAWINPFSVSGGGTIWGMRDGATFCPIIVYQSNADIQMIFSNGAVNGWANLYVGSGSGVLTAGKWSHIALQGNASFLTLFVDGVNRYQQSRINWTSTTYPMWLGFTNDGQGGFRGLIDEFRVTIGSNRYSMTGFNPATAYASGVLTLPTAINNNSVYHIRNIHTTSFTALVTASSSELVNGEAGLTLNPGETRTVISDGSAWITV